MRTRGRHRAQLACVMRIVTVDESLPARLHEQGFQTHLSLWPSMGPKLVPRVQVLRRRLPVPSRA